jgi:hypothetical protein
VKKAKNYIIIASALYLLQLILKFSKTTIPSWYSSYFSDFLCLPLLLFYALWILRKIKKSSSLILSWKMIFFAWIYVSIVFELLLPTFSHKFTADIFDVLVYGLGGLLYFVFQKQVIGSNSSITATR